MKRYSTHLCPKFQLAMDLLAKPWNGLIIAALKEGPLRFAEIAEVLDQIGDRILSARLKELQARGVVDRRVLPGPPVRVEYLLTPAGKGFLSVQDAVAKWGATLPSDGSNRSPGRKRR